jgi:putative membrane protein
MLRSRKAAVLSLFAPVLLVGASACKNEETPPPEAPQAATGTTTTTSSTSAVGDTFGALRAIHTAEVDLGSMAQKKATDPRVRAFATKVVNDHTTRMKKDDKIMAGLGISPTDNPVSQQISASADQEKARLDALSGADFDRAYIDEQIKYYRSAIDTFDKDLLPNVRDPQIRSRVEEARSRANDHLKEAQDLRLALINQ